MGIYLVKLAEWFPVGDDYHSTLMSIINCVRCLACDKKVRFKAAVGHHSLPFGNGDLFCSWKCSTSGKIAKEDKRRARRFNRKNKKNPFYVLKTN